MKKALIITKSSSNWEEWAASICFLVSAINRRRSIKNDTDSDADANANAYVNAHGNAHGDDNIDVRAFALNYGPTFSKLVE